MLDAIYLSAVERSAYATSMPLMLLATEFYWFYWLYWFIDVIGAMGSIGVNGD